MKTINFYTLLVIFTTSTFMHTSQRPDGLYEETTTQEQDFHSTGVLTIENSSGKTVVKGWERNSLLVQISKIASTQALLNRMRFELYLDESRASIKTIDVPQQTSFHGRNTGTRVMSIGSMNIGGNANVSFFGGSNSLFDSCNSSSSSSSNSAYVDYLIHVPNSAVVQAKTESGPIKLFSLLNITSTESSSGDIKAAGVGGNFNAKTMSGDVKIKGNLNSIMAQTMSGDVQVKGTSRAIMANTMSGAINARGYFDTVNAETMSGDITIDKAKSSQISTMSGRKRSSVWDGIPGDRNWSDSSSDEA